MKTGTVIAMFTAIIMLSPIVSLNTNGDVQENFDDQVSESRVYEEPYSPVPVDQEISAQTDHFLKNDGQLDSDDILYYTRTGGLRVGITEDHLIYNVASGTTSYTYTLEFLGTKGLKPIGMDPLEYETNYFIGPSENWITGVRSYSELLIKDVYEGIDLVYHLGPDGMKYDLIVKPGSDPSTIKMRYEGVSPRIVNGAIELETVSGTVVESAPYTFQELNTIESDYEINEGIVGFTIGDYDKNADLVIDPGIYLSTYIGSSNEDIVYDIKADDNGDIYLSGSTSSPAFPTTVGAYDTTQNSNRDAFVMKLNSSGDRLLYSTFLGTGGNDDGYALDIDSSGSAYVVGITRGSGYPTTSGSFRSTYGNNGDGFITKLSPNGNRLSYSAMMGGWSSDGAYDVMVDSSNRAVITGFSGWYWNNWWQDQWKFPTTSGAYDRTFNGNQNSYDVFLMRVASGGGSMDFSTLIGSSGNEYGYAISVDDDGDYFVTGETSSNGYPTTSGAYDRNRNSGDAFVSKFNSQGSSLRASTFLGGSGTEKGYGIAVNSSGNPVITGLTNSNNFPTSTGAYDRTHNGNNDVFVTIMADDLSSLESSTYIGSSSSDYSADLVLDDNDIIYVVGTTSSSNYPDTTNALQGSRAGSSDSFVSILDRSVGSLTYSTFFGGSGADYGEGIFVDDDGMVYIAGRTASTNLLTSMDAFDTAYSGGVDGFTTKFYPDDFSPSGLSGESGYFFVNLSWDPPSARFFQDFNIVGYRIYRGTATEEMAPIEEIGNITFYNDTIAYFISREYEYSVTAIFETIGESQFSNVIQATPMVSPFPNDPIPTSGDMFVNLTWDPIPSQFFSWFDITYVVHRGLTPEDLFMIAEVGTNTWYNDTDIIPTPRTYYYGISYLVRGVGESNMTSVISAKPNTPPAPPSDVMIMPGNLEMDVTWNSTIDNGGYPVTAYDIYNGPLDELLEVVTTVPSGSPLWKDESIIPGEIYHYRVKAVNRLGSSYFSPSSSEIGQTVPSEPVSFTITEGDGKLLLEWEEPEFTWGTEIGSYRIYDEAIQDSRILLREVDGTVTEFEILVENGVPGEYSVSAVNLHGEGNSTPILNSMGRGIPGIVDNPNIISGDSKADLTWGDFSITGGMDITSIKIYMGSTTDTRTLVATLPPDTKMFTKSGLLNGAVYYFWISGVNEMGEGPLTPPLQANPGRIPGKVDSISISAGIEKLTLQWSQPSDIGGREGLSYNIYRGMTNWTLMKIADIDFDITTFMDIGLDPQVRYVYSISMNNTFGEGPLSRIVGGTPYGKASPPVIIDHGVGSKKISLNWTVPENDGGSPITGYRVEYRKVGDLSWREVNEVETSTSIGGLRNGEVYTVKVLAITDITDGDPSREMDLLVGIPPEPPGSISVTGDTGLINVEWALRPDTDPVVLSYNIYIAVEGGEWNLAGSAGKSTFKYTIDGVMDGLTYSIALTSVNIVGESKLSGNRTIMVGAPPSQIPDVWVKEQGPSGIEIEWEEPEDNGGSPVTKYLVLRGTSPNSINEIASSESTLHIDTAIETGNTYYYGIIAENLIGKGPVSMVLEASSRSVPNAPKDFTHDVTSDEVSLSWKAPAYDGGSPVTGYHIYRTSEDGKKVLYAELEPDTFRFTDRAVPSGKYTYSVMAVNAIGEGEEASVDIDVPSRLLLLIVFFVVFLIIPIFALIIAAYLPRYLRNKRERGEREKEAKLALERQSQRQLSGRIAPGLPPGGYSPGQLGAHPQRAPSMRQLPPTSAPPPIAEEAADSGGYIRPSDSKKKRADKKTVLRSDGKSLEQKEKEEHITEISSKKKEEPKDWHLHKEEVLKKEAANVFTGQQPAQAPAPTPAPAPVPKPQPEPQEKDAPKMEDEVPGSEPPAMDIPEWGSEEIPVEDIPTKEDAPVPEEDENIDELEEVEELEELEDV